MSGARDKVQKLIFPGTASSSSRPSPNPLERMRQLVSIGANTTLLGIQVGDIIETDVTENVSTSHGGELTWEAVQ
jgi:hypothetical protein